jgi:hypothetical protein
VSLNPARSTGLVLFLSLTLGINHILLALLPPQGPSWTEAQAQGAPMGTMLLGKSLLNGRYFATPDGRIRYLNGGYEGSEFQDYVFGGSTTSDFQTALDILSKHGGNLLRLWTSESGRGNRTVRGAMQMPWVRSAVCCAADGDNKFDLSRFDVGNLTSPAINSVHYFERMRARVIAARAEGVYVSIMLWHSFGWENGRRIPSNRSWEAHPFNGRNNINGVNGDTDGDGQGLELGSLGQAFTPYQEAYVRQVIDAVGDLDNVLYEICNECYDDPETNAWQQYFIEFIRRYEAARRYRHPIGLTSLQNFNNHVLANSSADFISPGGPTYEQDPLPVAMHDQVSILDMDHVVPCTGSNDPRWPWKAFARGHNLWYIYCQGYGKPNGSEAAILDRMGQTWTYASRMNLADSVPETNSSVCSTRYCLMGPDSILGVLPDGGSITLELRAGTWSVEWLDPASGNTTVGSFVREGSRELAAPFHGEAVVFLVRNGVRRSGP